MSCPPAEGRESGREAQGLEVGRHVCDARAMRVHVRLALLPQPRAPSISDADGAYSLGS